MRLRTLDAAGDVGRYQDLIIRPDGTALVAYTDASAGTLKAASCGDPSCTNAAIATLDTGGPFAHVAVALSADDRAAIAYQHPATGSVKLALCRRRVRQRDHPDGGRPRRPVERAGGRCGC